jgi:competence protein ComFC
MMLVSINPTWIPGRWRLGVSLDVHTLSSEFLGYDDRGQPQFDTKRSEIGELLYGLKYAANAVAVGDIADTAASYLQMLAAPPFGFIPTIIVPTPPSRPRVRQPVFELATAIGQRLGVPALTDAVVRTKAVPELKEIADYTTRLDLLRDAHAVDAGKTAGASVLVLDDLFRSGASLNSVANVLIDAGGVADLCALTITGARSNR